MIEQDISPLMKDINALDHYIYSRYERVVEALVIQIELLAEQMVSGCIDLDPNQTKEYLQYICKKAKSDLRKTVETGSITYKD